MQNVLIHLFSDDKDEETVIEYILRLSALSRGTTKAIIQYSLGNKENASLVCNDHNTYKESSWGIEHSP